LEIERFEELLDRFCTHGGVEVVALDDPHLTPYQVDLDTAFDVGFDRSIVSQVVAASDAVAVNGDRLVPVGVKPRTRDDDAGRMRQPDGAVGYGSDLLGCVDGAYDLVAWSD